MLSWVILILCGASVVFKSLGGAVYFRGLFVLYGVLKRLFCFFLFFVFVCVCVCLCVCFLFARQMLGGNVLSTDWLHS